MEKEEKEEKKEREFGTIKMTKTDDGFRIDISGDLAKNCCCFGPMSKSDQSGWDCCSGDETKSDKKES